ncbi:hypothetical protein BC937DRAFT_90369 [Endogone sp. FLAS-F59071]|nr:hypothetical protein BC937DRAFT_90369 [Endogone sp. FLAS-F59071]|eukprot:RUS17142.1 hypothetical protein BC937DRAFT_90369 [Endogone sp. FLAS-F59071]
MSLGLCHSVSHSHPATINPLTLSSLLPVTVYTSILSSKSLRETLSAHVADPDLGPYHGRGLTTCLVTLKREGMPANLPPAFVDLTPYLDRPIVEALRGETVIEFPTLYVWTVKPPEGNALVEEKVEVVVPIGRKGKGMREEVVVEEAGEGEGEDEEMEGVPEEEEGAPEEEEGVPEEEEEVPEEEEEVPEEEEEVPEEEEEVPEEEGEAEVEKEEEIEDQILVDIEEAENFKQNYELP